MKSIFNKNGYSIVEIIIYLAIFTIMSVAVINSFIVSLSSFSSIKTNNDLIESADTLFDRMAYEVRQAKSIDVTNTNNTTLQLNSTDQSGNNITIKFAEELINGKNIINIYQNGNLIGNLLSQSISVNSLIFRKINTTNSEAVKIELELKDDRGVSHKTTKFYDTFVLRGSY